VLLLAFVVGAVAIVGATAGRRDWSLIIGGLLASAIANGVLLYQEATGGYAEGSPVHTLVMVAVALVAVAAWSGARRITSVEPSVNRSLFFPSLFAIVAVALQVHDLSRPLDPLVSALATATLAVVVLRLFVAFAENNRLLETVKREAVTDALTGLGNRRKLLTDLEAALASKEAPGGTAFAIFDLDGFKAYNDSYGHGAGDLLLARLGRNLAASVEPFGAAYRLGGDEFCVIVSGGEVKLDSILAAAGAALSEQGEGFSITCSRGWVRIPREATQPTETLRLADRRMYAEKGRRIDSAGRQTRNVLMSVLREREPELGDHLQGVAKLAVELGRRIALTAEELDTLGRAAELHDIGKMAIPDEILHKPGPLNDEEWALLRTHTMVGERILEAAPAMGPVARLVRWTHERWDGRGYPDGLRGEEVPLGARIIFVCDAFDAMTSERPYKHKISAEDALDELRRNSGTQFDPMVVELLCEVVSEGLAVAVSDDSGVEPAGERSGRVPSR
jgi:diguanylate cyclase (GGDEF)-like protein